MKILFFTALFLIASASRAHGQGFFVEISPSAEHLPSLPPPRTEIRSGTKPSHAFAALRATDAAALAERIRQEFRARQELVAQTAPNCTDLALSDYLFAQHELGQFQACVDLVRSCVEKGALAETSALSSLTTGIACAAARFDRTGARDLLVHLRQGAGRGAQGQSLDDTMGAYLVLSRLGEDLAWRDVADAAKLLEAQLPEATREVLAKFVRAGFQTPSAAEIAELDRWAEDTLSTKSEPGSYGKKILREQWFLTKVVQFAEDWLLSRLSRDSGPLHLVSLTRVAYFSLYRQPGLFRQAKVVYEAYLPFAHARGFLPTENNVHDYTELYSSICRDGLVTSEQRQRLLAAWQEVQKGSKSAAEFKNEVLRLASGGAKADLLTILGSLAEADGEADSARDFYWRAHRACPYFNRAHWGLVSVQRRERVAAADHFAKYEDLYTSILAGLPVSPSLSRYILNWSALPQNAQDRVRFGARLWLDHLPTFLAPATRLRAYIKMPFELLSESGDGRLRRLRDQRISSPGRERDQRLWDDVRGVGGDMVVADLGEVALAAQGAYNLLTHEMAHQFHVNSGTSLSTCIARLYAAAGQRQIFANPYSKTNDLEYFAEGTTYFYLGSDSPLGWGLNRGWYEKNDADLLSLISSLATLGDKGRSSCPI